MKLSRVVKYAIGSITFLVAAFLSFISLAQPTGGGPGGNPPPVPISGIELLLAAGAAYGAKKAYDVYHKRKQQ